MSISTRYSKILEDKISIDKLFPRMHLSESFNEEETFLDKLNNLEKELKDIKKEIKKQSFKISLTEKEKEIWNEIAGDIQICK